MEIDINEEDFKKNLRKQFGANLKPVVKLLDFRVDTLYDFLYDFYTVEDFSKLEEYSNVIKQVGMALLLIEIIMFFYSAKSDRIVEADTALNTILITLDKKNLIKQGSQEELELVYDILLTTKMLIYFNSSKFLGKVVLRLIHLKGFDSISIVEFSNIYSLVSSIIDLTNERFNIYTQAEKEIENGSN